MLHVKEQLMKVIQNSCRVNREHFCICSGVLWTWLDKTQCILSCLMSKGNWWCQSRIVVGLTESALAFVAASCERDLTRHNGLVTRDLNGLHCELKKSSKIFCWPPGRSPGIPKGPQTPGWEKLSYTNKKPATKTKKLNIQWGSENQPFEIRKHCFCCWCYSLTIEY